MPDNVLTACLRYNTEAEEAASFYVGIFKGSRLGGVHQHTEAGPSPAGSVMLVEFELNGQKFSALSGGAVRGLGRGRLLGQPAARGRTGSRRRLTVLTILLHEPLNPDADLHVIIVVGSMRGASLPRRSWYGIAGAAFLVASGAIHLDLYLTGYNSIPTIGPLFLLQIITAFLLAIAIPATGHRLAYAAGAGFAIATLGGYLLSLEVGLFGFTEVRTTSGIVAGIIDVAAFAVLAAGTLSGLAPARRSLPVVTSASVVALALLGVFVASPKSPPVTSASGTGASGQTLDAKSVNGAQLLTNSGGFVLYTFAPDKTDKSVCYRTCASYWPPVPGNMSAGPGVSGKIGTIKRTDGTTQATYDGHPLYTYVGDKSPGQDGGNNINLNGGLWRDVPVTGG
jgi:predicted lipoprotein with Yx(FWY)xxD motif